MRKFVFLAISLLMISCSNMDDLSQNLNTEDTANRDAILSISDAGSVVTTETATLVAKNKLGKPESRSSAEVSVEPMLVETGKEIAYVVNYGTNDGYVVVNANKQLSPVLPYSETGHFDAEQAKGTPAAEWIAHMATVSTDNMPDSISQSIAVEWDAMSRKEVAYQQLSSRSAQEDPDVEATISQAIAKWRSQGYTVTPVKGANASSYPTKIANAISSLQNSGSLSSNLNRSYILKKENRVTNQSGPYDKTQWSMNPPYDATAITKRSVLSSPTIFVAKILYYHNSPTSLNLRQLPLSMTVGSADDPLPMFLFEVVKKCGLAYMPVDSVQGLSDIKNGLSGYNYHYDTCDYNFDKVWNSITSYGPLVLQYKKDENSNGVSNSTKICWLCDGCHVYVVQTEYKVMEYSGDFAEIDPTAAFYSSAYDVSQSTSPRALHFLWLQNSSADGYYYDTDWSVNLWGSTLTIGRKDVKTLINIYPY